MYVYIHRSVCVCVQDPPNGALECMVDGVARTTVITITAPVLVTADESGVVTLTYDADLVSMTRGGPTAANMTAPAEAVMEEQVVVCDETSGVSLYIDDVSSTDCPSPMFSVNSICYAAFENSGASCAAGWQLIDSYDLDSYGPFCSQS